MATKTIDVTLATMRNAGTVNVSPKGVIQCRIVRAVDDEQIFQNFAVFSRKTGNKRAETSSLMTASTAKSVFRSRPYE